MSIYRGTRQWVAVVVVAAATAVGGLSSPARATTAPYFPTRLAHVGNAQQLLVVTGTSTASSYATMRAYQRGSDGVWRLAFAPMAARSGYAGWVAGASRVENSGTTPIGTYGLTTAFGLASNPGTRLRYFHVDQDDYMPGDPRDPRTYNVLQTSASSVRTWRTGTATAERFGTYPVQYRYGVMIDYNRPAASSVTWSGTHREYVTSQPADVRLGYSIYLHINGRGATAGCLSLSQTDEVKVLHWLNPALHPRVVMAPLWAIGRA